MRINKKHAVLIALGITLTLVLGLLRAGSVSLWVAIADGLLAVALAYLFLYSMRVISRGGALDIFGYAFYLICSPFSGKMRRGTKTYYEYQESRKHSRKPLGRELLYIGLIFLLPSIVLGVLL